MHTLKDLSRCDDTGYFSSELLEQLSMLLIKKLQKYIKAVNNKGTELFADAMLSSEMTNFCNVFGFLRIEEHARSSFQIYLPVTAVKDMLCIFGLNAAGIAKVDQKNVFCSVHILTR